MTVFNFVIIIVIASLIFAYFSERQKILLNNKHSKKQQDAFEDEIAALKERVETLEKIVTDKGYDLKSEIDNL